MLEDQPKKRRVVARPRKLNSYQLWASQVDGQMATDRDWSVRLVDEVRNRPCLYDTTHPDYKDRHHLDSVWASVGQAMGTSAENAKRRWQNLRGSFSKSVNSRLPNGPPRFYLKQKMAFLLPFMGSPSTGKGRPGRKSLKSNSSQPVGFQLKMENFSDDDEADDEHHDDNAEDGEEGGNDEQTKSGESEGEVSHPDIENDEDESWPPEAWVQSPISLASINREDTTENATPSLSLSSELTPQLTTTAPGSTSGVNTPAAFTNGKFYGSRKRAKRSLPSPTDPLLEASTTDPDLSFFRGLLPYVKELSKRRKRHFFHFVSNELFNSLNEQEQEDTKVQL